MGIGPYGGLQEVRWGGRPQGSPLRKRYKGGRGERNPPVTASPCQPPLGKGALRTGEADCHSRCAHRLRNDTFYKRCGTASAGGQRRPPLRMTRKFVQARERADVGSELSAAGGRGSEVSEWPRSKFPASAVRQRRNFGHRNRVIVPYGV